MFRRLNHKRLKGVFTLTAMLTCLVSLIFSFASFYLATGGKSTPYSGKGSHQSNLTYDIYAGASLLFKNTTLPKNVAANGETIRVTAKVPKAEEREKDANALLFVTDHSRFILRVDGHEAVSSPEKGIVPSFLYGPRNLYVEKFPEGLGGKEISLELETEKMGEHSTLNLSPIIAASSEAIYRAFKPSALLFFITGVAYSVLLFIALLFLPLIAEKGDRRWVRRFAFAWAITGIYVITHIATKTLVYKNPIFWGALYSFALAFMPSAYISLFEGSTGAMNFKGTVMTLYRILPPAILSVAMALTLFRIKEASILYFLISMIALSFFPVLFLKTFFLRTMIKSKSMLPYILSALLMSVSMSAYNLLQYAGNYSLRATALLTITTTLSFFVCAVRSASERLRERMALLRERDLAELAYQDMLSKCLNRRSYEDFVKDERKWPQTPFYIVNIDINSMKTVNDCYGHSEGDRLIRHFGQAVLPILPTGSKSFRTGGDEFMLAIPKIPSSSKERVERMVKESYSEDAPYGTSLSCGVLEFSGKGEEELREALREADALMYEDKAKNRGSEALLTKARKVSDAGRIL